jgi:hypothetical protein
MKSSMDLQTCSLRDQLCLVSSVKMLENPGLEVAKDVLKFIKMNMHMRAKDKEW